MNKLNFLKDFKIARPSVGKIIFWIIAIGLALGSYLFVRELVTCWTITPLPGMPPSDCGTVTAGLRGPVLNEEGTPVATTDAPPPPASIPELELPPAWDGASRINVLVIGLDYRDWEAGVGAPRSDTMILLTIDPLTKTAGMLSIPRDMWVNIPGFGYSRINTAYSSGESNKLPGGGPALAMKTVEQFIGVPVHYYAQIDFNTFVEFIDLIGGIDIYNDEELRLDPVGGGLDKIRLTCCGMRHLDGRKTLAYVRYRKGDDGDIGRARRQQKAILAIRDKVFSPEVFPMLISNANQLYNEFSSGIKTNMPFDTALRLAVLAKDIPVESIKQGVIDYSMVTLDNVVLGGENASIMKPLPDKIRILRDEIFTSGGALSPLAAQGDPVALMKADAARVRILNGSYTPGLEVTTGNYFLAQGLAVTEVGPADRAYDRTVIVLYSPKLYTLKYLQTLFGINSNTQILIKPDPASTVDVEVRLGNDWANSNPMP
ncbi:MAG TPA: LCP family protein [Anaerolineales bacterium]|nr:LCP family protein [Anaerolineales bacterium]